MNTIACKHCNHLISKAADICPQCKNPTYSVPEVYRNCRVCGERLLQDKYRELCTILGRRKVTRKADMFCYIKHTSCPKCGEPEPLKCFWDTPVAELLVFLLVFAGGLMSFFCFMTLSGLWAHGTVALDYTFSSRVLAALFMVSYLVLILIINRWRSMGIPDIKTGYIVLAVIVVLALGLNFVPALG